MMENKTNGNKHRRGDQQVKPVIYVEVVNPAIEAKNTQTEMINRVRYYLYNRTFDTMTTGDWGLNVYYNEGAEFYRKVIAGEVGEDVN